MCITEYLLCTDDGSLTNDNDFLTTCRHFANKSARGPFRENIDLGSDSADLAQRDLYIKDRGPIFFQYGPKQAGLIRDLLPDWERKQFLYSVQL